MYSNIIRHRRIGISYAIKYKAKNEFILSNEQINDEPDLHIWKCWTNELIKLVNRWRPYISFLHIVFMNFLILPLGQLDSIVAYSRPSLVAGIKKPATHAGIGGIALPGNKP